MATGKTLTDHLPTLKPYNALPHWNGGIFRSRPDIRIGVSPTRGSNFWGPRESIHQILDMEEIHFSLKRVFVVDVIFGLATSSSSPFDDAIGQGISPLGYIVKRLANRLPKVSLIT